eukprot:CAMPEP_0175876310 /NCGR_PEP_ID=MMETSP0107_2-20121207/39977_1 /TAXON_ID=195067 ORGANISM="Goniomonas pacifica, Strain CCMP1869" /NCGR_SAMPLE_ID=MMETSP0107_2 /ASSEMBLY_ACC=CAM_ASM_000203 /LENGTH=38 /DNA_ID= /DNA_START= /DNA_END= /DNA_ORIENTATION=
MCTLFQSAQGDVLPQTSATLLPEAIQPCRRHVLVHVRG